MHMSERSESRLSASGRSTVCSHGVAVVRWPVSTVDSTVKFKHTRRYQLRDMSTRNQTADATIQKLASSRDVRLSLEHHVPAGPCPKRLFWQEAWAPSVPGECIMYTSFSSTR